MPETTPIPAVPPNFLAKTEQLDAAGPSTYDALQKLWGCGNINSTHAAGSALVRKGFAEKCDVEGPGGKIEKGLRVTELGRRALKELPRKPVLKRTPKAKAAPAPKVSPAKAAPSAKPAKKVPAPKGDATNGHSPEPRAAVKREPIVVRLDDMVVELPTVADVVELRRALRGA